MGVSSIQQRLLRGLGANVYGRAITVVVQLVGVPVLLEAWGKALYGEWLILFAIPSYLSMMDLGFSLSAANDMSARLGRGDRMGAQAIFQNMSALVFLVAIAVLFLVSLFDMMFPLGAWFHFSALGAGEVRWVLWLLAAEVIIKLIDGISHAGFRANGDYALHVAINTTAMLVQHTGIWVLATMGYGVVAAAIAFLAVRLIETVGSMKLLMWRHEWLSFSVRKTRFIDLRGLIRPSLANISMPLAQAVNVQGMVLVVGAMLGPVSVVAFSTLRTLTRLILQLVMSVSHALEPELAAAWGAKDQSLLGRLYVQGMRLSLWVGLCAVCALFFEGERILAIWTHGKIVMDPLLYRWLLLSAFASALWYGSLNLLKATNRHLRAALLYVISSLVAIGLAASLLDATGRLADVGLSLLFMDAAMAIYVTPAAGRLSGLPFVALLKQTFDLRPLIKSTLSRISHAR